MMYFTKDNPSLPVIVVVVVMVIIVIVVLVADLLGLFFIHFFKCLHEYLLLRLACYNIVRGAAVYGEFRRGRRIAETGKGCNAGSAVCV